MAHGMPAAATADACNLYVNELPADADDLFLYRTFAPFGAISSVPACPLCLTLSVCTCCCALAVLLAANFVFVTAPRSLADARRLGYNALCLPTCLCDISLQVGAIAFSPSFSPAPRSTRRACVRTCTPTDVGAAQRAPRRTSLALTHTYLYVLDRCG